MSSNYDGFISTDIENIPLISSDYVQCPVSFRERILPPPPAPTVARKPSKPGEKTELPDSQYVLIYGKSTCSLAHKDVLNGAVGKHWNLRL